MNFTARHDQTGLSISNADAPVWRPRQRTLHNRAILILATSDLTIMAAIFIFSAWLADAQGDGWKLFTAALIPTYMVFAMRGQAFHAYALTNPFTSIANSCRAFMMALGLLILIAFYAKSADAFPRLTIAIGSAAGMFFLAASRYVLVRMLPRLIGGNPFETILIRDGDVTVPAGEFSVIIDAESFFDPDLHDPRMYDRLANSLTAADRVVIVCPQSRRLAWAHAVQGANIQAEIVLPELAAIRPLGLGPNLLVPSLIVATAPLSLVDRAVKRAFDLVVATLALVLMSPLFGIVALLVKLDSAGPVFFKQLRIGRGNQLFYVYKFRSMRAEKADHDADRLVVRNDDRVTRVGHFIRKTSIDELPQLIQVLTGHMSLVGPRPHAMGARAASKLYWEVDTRYWHRHAAKPGMTGLAQVRGYRGNTELEEDLSNRLSSDLEYVGAWSIWRDLKIIFLTIRVLFHRNAF